jgi:hypothetical protein
MRRFPRSGALVFVLLTVGLPAPAGGQQRSAPAAETPEQVTARIVSAMRTQDWTAVAALMHPAALAELRSLFDILLVSEDEGAAGARAQLFGVETVAEARALSDTLVFSRLMEALMSQQELGAVLASAEVTMLGHVPEGADTVHVVYRMSMSVSDISISMMDVASMVRYGSTWRGLLKGDMRALAAGVRQAMLEGGGAEQ